MFVPSGGRPTAPLSLPLMLSIRQLVPAFLLAAAAPLAAQTASPAKAPSADTAKVDDEGVRLGFQFGVTSGALAYRDGRTEQALGAIVRWAPVHWFSLSATPTGVHSTTAPVPGSPQVSRSGLVDLPVTAAVSHRFDSRFSPQLTGGIGISLPTGDTATGFGSGQLGTELEVGAGISPTDRTWLSIGAGRSLSSGAMQSAFTGASGWGDVSAGGSLTERLSVDAGYDSDLGPVQDPTIGRSTSMNAALGYVVHGPTSVNVSASHGLGGAAPRWSLAFGIGTAFPVLGHANAAPLAKAFGNSNRTGLSHRPVR